MCSKSGGQDATELDCREEIMDQIYEFFFFLVVGGYLSIAAIIIIALFVYLNRRED